MTSITRIPTVATALDLGSSPNWVNPGNVLLPNASSASVTLGVDETGNDPLLVTGFDFSLFVTLVGVAVAVTASATTSDSRTNFNMTNAAGTATYGNSKGFFNTILSKTVAGGDATDLWGTGPPITVATLTPSWGIWITGQMVNGGSGTVSVQWVTVTLYGIANEGSGIVTTVVGQGLV